MVTALTTQEPNAMPRIPTFAVPIVAGICLASSPTAPRAADWTAEQDDHGVTVKIDGQLFTQYLIDACPKPILWPIVGPTGAEMTRAYPMRTEVAGEKQDHPHQRSLWFTHGNVNGVDFWSEQTGHGSIVHREFTQVEGGPRATFTAVNDWLDPDGRKLLEDERTLTFRSGDGWRSIDFDITLKATAGPVTFGDTKEGMMGIRVPTVMDVDEGGRIISSEGITNKEAWGKSAAWVDYQGTVEGELVGVAILNHPSSFRAPTHWHVRDYGLFAANPFGLHDFTGSNEVDGSYTIPDGDSITFRYRFLFHRGDEQSAQVAKAYESYAAEERP
jgi:hypothetical protein